MMARRRAPIYAGALVLHEIITAIHARVLTVVVIVLCFITQCCVSPPFMSHSMSRTRFVERAVRDLTGKRPDVAVINVMTCQLCIVSVRAVLFQTKTLCLLFLMSSSLSY